MREQNAIRKKAQVDKQRRLDKSRKAGQKKKRKGYDLWGGDDGNIDGRAEKEHMWPPEAQYCDPKMTRAAKVGECRLSRPCFFAI